MYSSLPLVACAILINISSCKKLIEIDPPIDSETSKSIYADNNSSAAALNGMYITMSNEGYGGAFTGRRSISFTAGLSADELTLRPNGAASLALPDYYKNSLSSNITVSAWGLYQPIYHSNAAIIGLNTSTTVSPEIKNQLLGEAKFIRAFCYFYLTNLFGNIPMPLSTDYITNSRIVKSTQHDVYSQIINDLKDAQHLLHSEFLKGNANTPYSLGSEERVRPTKWAATALLARVHLYNNDWTNAESEATKIIENNAYFSLHTDLNMVFVKNNHEAIWQLQPATVGENTKDGAAFILTSTGPNTSSRPAYLSRQLMNSFEAGDLRKSNWTQSVTVGTNSYNYAFKYKIGTVGQPLTEYIMVLRLAEQYLIRAEARANLDRITGLNSAQNDLNIIRQRAGLQDTTATSKDEIISLILHERQVELFTEWGHRWLDLKRTGRIDEVMNIVTPIKGGVWNTNWKLYPLRGNDLVLNPNLMPNNSGY